MKLKTTLAAGRQPFALGLLGRCPRPRSRSS